MNRAMTAPRLRNFQRLSGNQLKVIAAICMLVDHITKVFYESLTSIINSMIDAGFMTASQHFFVHGIYDILITIGAVAFPVFAFLFAEGFQHTHNRKKYLLRLALFAVITELPFDLTFFNARKISDTENWIWYWYHQNVFFTYLQAGCTLWGMEAAGKIKSKPLALLLQGGILGLSCLLSDQVVLGDYDVYGIVLIVVIYYLRKNRLYQILGMAAVKLWLNPQYFPIAFLISLGLILLYNGQRGQRNMKNFFYIFYPAHIAAIGLLDWLIFSVFWGLW